MEHNFCEKNWWKNLLYVQNFLSEEPCLGVTWYLANDFQFFIISPPIIWSLWRFPIFGLILSGALTVAATILPIYLAWVNEWGFNGFLMSGKSMTRNSTTCHSSATGNHCWRC